MYLDCKVDIPNAPGKISFITKGTTKYVRYVAERKYIKDKKYTRPTTRLLVRCLEVMIPRWCRMRIIYVTLVLLNFRRLEKMTTEAAA